MKTSRAAMRPHLAAAMAVVVVLSAAPAFSTASFAAAADGAAEAGASASAGLLRPGPPPLERFVGPLSLTPPQQAKLRPLFAQARQRAEQDVKDASADGQKPDPAKIESAWRMHEADFRLRLAEVLTPAQLARYEQMTADRTPREKAGEMHSGHGHRESDTPATAAERDE